MLGRPTPTTEKGTPTRTQYAVDCGGKKAGSGLLPIRIRKAAAKGRSEPMNITGAQIRAARALLGWSTRDLAKRASLTVPVILQIDSEGVPGLAAIQRALEAAGVVVFTNGDEPGVKLRAKKGKRSGERHGRSATPNQASSRIVGQ